MRCPSPTCTHGPEAVHVAALCPVCDKPYGLSELVVLEGVGRVHSLCSPAYRAEYFAIVGSVEPAYIVWKAA